MATIPRLLGDWEKWTKHAKPTWATSQDPVLKRAPPKNNNQIPVLYKWACPSDIGDRLWELVVWTDAPFPGGCEFKSQGCVFICPNQHIVLSWAEQALTDFCYWVTMNALLASGKPRLTWKPYFPNSYVKGFTLRSKHYSINCAFSPPGAHVICKHACR